MSRKITPDDAEVLYIAAVHSVEEVRNQILRLGLEDVGPEDAEVLREDLLREVERLREESSG